MPPTSEAPANPAVLCKNPRRVKPDFFISRSPLRRTSCNFRFGNKQWAFFFYVAPQSLSRFRFSFKSILGVHFELAKVEHGRRIPLARDNGSQVTEGNDQLRYVATM